MLFIAHPLERLVHPMNVPKQYNAPSRIIYGKRELYVNRLNNLRSNIPIGNSSAERDRIER